MTDLTRVFILLRDGSFTGRPASALPGVHVAHVEENDRYDDPANENHEDLFLEIKKQGFRVFIKAYEDTLLEKG